MTLQREPAATGENSDRPNVESNRLLCNDGDPAPCRAGLRESQDSYGVDGRTVTDLDAGLCMRRGGRAESLPISLTAMSSASRLGVGWGPLGVRPLGYDPNGPGGLEVFGPLLAGDRWKTAMERVIFGHREEERALPRQKDA